MKKFVFWFLAFLVTAFILVYQRITGPTYPISGKTALAETEISFELPRTHVVTSDCKVSVAVPHSEIKGILVYKRFKTQDAWTKQPMQREENALVGYLPKQPSAGKLEYRVILSYQDQQVSLPGETPVVIRYKGEVPLLVIILHVVVIFLALLFSTRAGLEALSPKGNPRKLAILTTVLLFLGGMILGPVMQKYAFGAFWTGFPFGIDLTDNKTLIAMIGWIIAMIAGRKGRTARGWVIAASVLTLVIFLVPHSLLGSELDYSKMEHVNSSISSQSSSMVYFSFLSSLNRTVTVNTTGVGFPLLINGS